MANPVIFVHGIQGSWLKNQYPVDYQNEIYWDAILRKDFDKIKLSPLDQGVDQGDEYLIAAHQTISLIYSSLMREIREDVTPASYVFTYDWRKDNRVSAKLLGGFVDLVIHKAQVHAKERRIAMEGGDVGVRGDDELPDKVSLVGHSMGGLVMKWYLTQELSPGDWGKIDKIITIATPYKGSLKAIEALLPGARNFFGIENDKTMRQAARTFPGVYQLLPSYAGSVVDMSGAALDIYKQENWQASLVKTMADTYGPAFFQGRLDDARSFAAAIAPDYPAQLLERFSYIYGHGSETWRTIQVDTRSQNEFDFSEVVKDEEGDGTVHALSAQQPPHEEVLVDDKEISDLLAGQHAMMPTHHEVQDKVVELLGEGGRHRTFVSPR
jgi:hypothetical protein